MSATPLVRRRASLRVELIAMLAIVLVMAVVSLSFAAEWLGQRRHDQHEIERLSAHTRGLAILAARSFRGGDFERDDLETLLGDSAAQLGVSYEVHRFSGRAEPERIAAVGMHAGFAELPRPRADRAWVDESLIDRWNLLVIDEPVSAQGDQRVVLRLIAEHAPWTRSHDWRETLIVAGGVGLVLLLLGGAMLELQVLRPMRALERSVGQVASGRLDVEAPTEGPRELAELAQTFNDMTASLRRQQAELRSAAEQLQRSERLATIGRLAAGLAHEVGNPLAAIIGYVELLLGGDLGPDDRDLLERVLTQTQRIQAIVGQLLDFSKPTQVQAIELRAGDPIARVVALLRVDPRCADVELVVSGAIELELRGDPGLVEQILINLVLNAALAVKDLGERSARVELVVLELGDDRVGIEVRDNGPGVPAELRERVFEPFFTARTARGAGEGFTTRGAGEGTGLGLAISQGLAESMAGTLECREHAGPGAVFRLSLARARA